ncbi:MAG: mechanosensitive ion channel family protein [Gemmatimonadales bacterium]
MNELMDRLQTGFQQLWAVVPALAAAAVILLLGYFVARTVEKWTDRTLKRLDFNKVAEAGGLREAVDRTGGGLDPVHAVGKLLFWLIMLIVILLASAALGLDSINRMFGIMLGFIPTLIAAIVIVILGIVVGEFVRGLILASAGTMEGVPILANVAKGSVVIIAVFMALQQLGVAAELITAAFTLVLGAVALAVGLAFGLGNTTLAGEVTRRWYQAQRERRQRAAEARRAAEEAAAASE